MARAVGSTIDRRAFLFGAGALVACARDRSAPSRDATPTSIADGSIADAVIADAVTPASIYPLFDAFPALARALPRTPLARFPSEVQAATKLVPGARVHVKRDDDFTRSLSYDPRDPTSATARAFGGGKLRKLELFFGEAQSVGARTLVTFGGVGSNQALAVAILSRTIGADARLYLAPQPKSSLTTTNLAADAASGAEMRLFSSVIEAEAAARKELAADATLYAIPPGGTTPLGTIGFVDAGLELAEDVRAGRLPAPRRIYVALGLGGTAVGLAIGCALAGSKTQIVAVRASNPTTVTNETLRAIHERTIAFLRARAPTFPALPFEASALRIEGRFVGRGYGFATTAGDDAVARAKATEGWSLDPVYTGKALAALLADVVHDDAPVLFWNTASSRPLAHAEVPPPFRRFVETP